MYTFLLEPNKSIPRLNRYQFFMNTKCFRFDPVNVCSIGLFSCFHFVECFQFDFVERKKNTKFHRFPIHTSLMYLLQFHYVNILTHSHTQNTNHNLAKFSPINKCDKQTLSSLQCRSSDVSIWSIKCAQRDSHLFSDEAAFKIHDINHYQINDIICDGKTKTTRCAYSYRVAEIFFSPSQFTNLFRKTRKASFLEGVENVQRNRIETSEKM